MEDRVSISIDLTHIEEGLILLIDERKGQTLFDVDDAVENNEARYQLVEGFAYDYEFSLERFAFAKDQIVQPHSRKTHVGTISPNIFVGTLSLTVYEKGEQKGQVLLEVQSVKSSYRDDYRTMLAFITEKCVDLLMQANSPVSHQFESDYTKRTETLYQQFAFIQSILLTTEFSESIYRIVSSPVTNWQETSSRQDIRQIRRFTHANTKELLKGSNRTKVSSTHIVHTYGLTSLPTHILSTNKIDSLDTPENRFVKHALSVFLTFCSNVNRAAPPDSKLFKESLLLIHTLESHLNQSMFREIARPTSLSISSPILQRKEGYREVLRAWLMFDLAAKLTWEGGDDIYSAGKKDIAVLYEYWLFFTLLDLFESLFDIDAKDVSDLIKETADGLNFQLKQGKQTALNGVFDSGTRQLNIRFCYNRSFSGQNDYPKSGSWTTTMRPDYTLSFWPHGTDEQEAEKQELIVHIHFDAKYKVANLTEILREGQGNLQEEKIEQRKGIYKNADLLKMHAYKDAIRRTAGAYVLYPGERKIQKQGFHEIIPGLGAFPISPSKTDNGIRALREFIQQVIAHFMNRASQRERLAYKVYDLYQDDQPNELNESIPEAYGPNRSLIPDETFVLVGYSKSKEHYQWIIKNKLYNFRMGTSQGSLPLDVETVGAKYLLLHRKGQVHTGDIWKISSRGPKVYSRQDLLKKDYPGPSKESSNYLVFSIEKVSGQDFKGAIWDLRNLQNYGSYRASALPFTTSLTKLMKAKV